ncbi:unnamed protein product [Caenorhabditis bovis]|uniref:Uncharacterized protein n=1 Tax=Caenorhabditis bovis TaxID=2654633 RepID=A0A8S1EDK9_9PELO|nr:unnamed protein product [Caenorhabditis bovis]
MSSDQHSYAEISESKPTSLVCKICTHTAHGVHFGVSSCRACAAFFRRSVVLGKKYKCRGVNKLCPINAAERFLCRHCRFKKCIKVGMTADNVQWNRDVLSINEEKPKQKITRNIKRTSSPPALYDISDTMKRIEQIFSEPILPMHSEKYREMNTLQRLDWALKQHRIGQKDKRLITFRNFIDLGQIVSLNREEMCRVAKWMIHCDEFRDLQLNEKMSFFKLVWALWQKLERITRSIDVFGLQMYEDKIFIMSDKHAINMNKVQFDISPLTDLPVERIKSIFDPFCIRMFENIAKPLIDIKLESMEVTFMLCYLCFQISGKVLQGRILEASEKFMEKVSNNLHDYYEKDVKTKNYASRLIKIMSVLNAFQKIHSDRQEIIDLAKIFKIFKVRLTEPEVNIE